MNVIGPTTIPYSTFYTVLQRVQSPALIEAQGMYNIFKEYGIPAELGLAFFYVESRCGTLGICKQYDTKSIGNVRSPENPKYGGINISTPQGLYTRYSTWVNGTKDWCERILGPKYVGMGLDTIEEILPKYAPSFDNNNPAAYVNSLQTLITSWKGMTPMVTKPIMQSNPSPNYYVGNFKAEAIVWHVTAGSGASALSWLTNPNSGASCNFLIMENGTIRMLVDPSTGKSAWTNGLDYDEYPNGKRSDMSNPLVASWIRNKINPNRRTISIEHAGRTGQDVNAVQIQASIHLTAWLCQQYNLTPDRTHIIKHAQIDGIDRPYCPGFTEAQWNDRVAKVAAMVRGTTGKVPIVEPAKEGKIMSDIAKQGPLVVTGIDENGEPYVVIKFGGQMKAAPNVNIQDIGITGIGMDDAEYDRSVQQNAFTEYGRTPRP